MAPLGFFIWIAMQFGLTKKLMLLFLKDTSHLIQTLNVIVAIISFFSFLIGVYFLVFSREKIEDEMIQKTRLDSFQFAALVQLVCTIIGFISMAIFNESGDGILILFFTCLLFVFWVSFIFRFNYIIHLRIKQLNEKHFES